MKTAKLVTGILSIVLCVFVTFQSCAAGLVNALEDNGEVSGSAGVMVAICLLTAGIVSIATRNKEKNGGNIACIILYMIGALMGGIIGRKLCRSENMGWLCRDLWYYTSDVCYKV